MFEVHLARGSALQVTYVGCADRGIAGLSREIRFLEAALDGDVQDWRTSTVPALAVVEAADAPEAPVVVKSYWRALLGSWWRRLRRLWPW